jgi:HEAT repeat protein
LNEDSSIAPAKPRRRLWAKLLTLGLIIGAILPLVIPSREPSARGRPLSHWLETLVHTIDSDARDDAHAAVEEIGNAAIPTLLRNLRADESFRQKIAPIWNNWVERAPYDWQNTLRMDAYRASKLQLRAFHGFDVLGTNAAGAVPALRKMLNDENHVHDAIACLARVQTDAALAALIPMLAHTNPAVRAEAVNAVINFGPRALAVAEQIVLLTSDPDEYTAHCATRVVGDLLPASRAIPLLLDRLNDSRPSVVEGALNDFCFRGPLAESAMPAIARLLTNSEPKTRQHATGVLVYINPHRAHEFGIQTNGMSENVYISRERTLQRLATNTSPWRSW